MSEHQSKDRPPAATWRRPAPSSLPRDALLLGCTSTTATGPNGTMYGGDVCNLGGQPGGSSKSSKGVHGRGSFVVDGVGPGVIQSSISTPVPLVPHSTPSTETHLPRPTSKWRLGGWGEDGATPEAAREPSVPGVLLRSSLSPSGGS